MILAIAFAEDWGLHQDYGWFLAVVFWALATVGFASRKHWGDATPCLMAFALANLAMPALEMADFFVDLHSNSQSAIRFLIQDIAIGSTQALATLFLGLAGLSVSPMKQRRPVPLALLAIGLVVVILFLKWRDGNPIAAGTLLGLADIGMVAWLLQQRAFLLGRRGLYWTLGLGLWCTLFWVATTGPLAYLFDDGKRFGDFSRFSAPAQLVSMSAGAVFCLAVWRLRLGAGTTGSPWNETRRALWALMVWLIIGFFFVGWSGRATRITYETNLLRRARLIAASLDKAALESALGPSFQLGRIERRPRIDLHTHAPSTLTLVRNPRANEPEFNLLRRQLSTFYQANDDFGFFDLVVLRDGWIAAVVKWPDEGRFYPEVYLKKPGAEMEKLSQSGADGLVFGPTPEGWGYVVRARVPLPGPANETVLGWLDIQIIATNWAIEFSQARLQAMYGLLVGVLLWATAVGLRLRRIRQSEAEALTKSAVAADQAKSRFLANVSHELRTPLQGMLGYAELMAGGSLEPEQRRRLDAVITQGVVLKRLVNDLIDLGSMAAGSFRLVPTVFHPLKLAQECVDAVRPSALAKQLELVLHCDAALTDTSMLQADAVRLRQVLLNLLGNAVKFTPAGKVTLEISIRELAADSPTVQLHAVVRDDGPGIPAAMRSRLFKPFSTLGLQADKEGAGLGLAISTAIVKEMGGDLVLLAEETPGTAFQFHVRCQRTARAEIPAPPTALVPWNQLTLLVADDNLLVRTWLTEFFATRGAVVKTVTNGLDAVRICADQRFDLVILDISMPMLDGWTAARQLRESAATRGKPRLVGLSAHASDADHLRAREAGFDVFLTKPIGLAELTAALSGLRLGEGVDAMLVPTDGDNALLKRMEAIYWRELPQALERLRSALAAGDRHGLATAAHHLKNSADITRQIAVSRLCQQLQTEAASATGAQLDAMVENISQVCSTGSGADQSAVKIVSD